MKPFNNVNEADEWMTEVGGSIASVYVSTKIPIMNPLTGENWKNGVPRLAFGDQNETPVKVFQEVVDTVSQPEVLSTYLTKEY